MALTSVCGAETTAAQFDANWPFDFRTAFAYDSDGHPLSEVTWLGRFFDDGPPTAHRFVLRVYSHLDGHPGEILHLRTLRLTLPPEPQPDQSYLYTATVDNPVDLPALTTVWIEIQAHSDGLPQWGVDQILSPAVGTLRQIKSSIEVPREWTTYSAFGDARPIAEHNASLAAPSTTQASGASQCHLISNEDRTASHLKLSLVSSGIIDVRIYDASGREVIRPFLGFVQSGTSTVDISMSLARLRSSGVYFINVQLDATVSLLKQKLVLVK